MKTKLLNVVLVSVVFYLPFFHNRTILNKDVKVPAYTVCAIKNEMPRLIEAKETSTDEPDALKPSGNDFFRQGDVLPP